MPGGKRNLPVEEEDGTASEASGGQESAMMAMIRVLMEEQRKAELAREEHRRREELERRDLQAAAEARQYEQQLTLLKIQQEMGEKATLAHREFQEVDKRRDRVLFSMPTFREGEDLEEYFSTAERKMVAAKLPRGDWLTMLDARFTGRVAVAWRDLSAEGIEFEEAKSRLLKSCGYTPRVAADT